MRKPAPRSADLHQVVDARLGDGWAAGVHGDLVRVARQVHAGGRAGDDMVAVTGDVDRVTGPGQGDVVTVPFQVDDGVLAGHRQRGTALVDGDRTAAARTAARGRTGACGRTAAGPRGA